MIANRRQNYGGAVAMVATGGLGSPGGVFVLTGHVTGLWLRAVTEDASLRQQQESLLATSEPEPLSSSTARS